MLGTLVLGILVIGIVTLFTTLAYNLASNKQHEQAQAPKQGVYHFIIDAGFRPTGCSIYLNDSLLYSGTTTSDTTISIENVSEEDALIIVDNTTDRMRFAEIPEKQGTYHVIENHEGIKLVERHHSTGGASTAR